MDLRKWIPLWAYGAALLFSAGTIWLRLEIVRLGYEVHQIDVKMVEARSENEKLKLKTAQLRSPVRLQALAQKVFELSAPLPDQVISMRDQE